MMRYRPSHFIFCILLIAFASVFTTSSAHASGDRYDDHDEAMRYQEAGKILPLEQITGAAVRAAGGGEVIEIEFEVRGGRPICEVKVIDLDGRVRKITVDAQDGRVLSSDDRRGRGRGRGRDKAKDRDDD